MNKKLKNIDVFILCGGMGKRLGNICADIPKPMIKIGDGPFLNIIIRHLYSFGLRRFILGTGYKSEVVKRYYKEFSSPGIKIYFSREKTPLGTGGALKNAKRYIRSNDFFVLNGDSFSDFHPIKLFSFHKINKAVCTILLRRSGGTGDFGSVQINSSSRITSFNEKLDSKKTSFINTGVYVFNKKVFSLLPKKASFSLEYDLFPKILQNKVLGFPNNGFFIDIGIPSRLNRAIQKMRLRNV